MAITFSLIEKAVLLATKVFTTVRSTQRSEAPDQDAVVSALDDVSKRIDSLPASVARSVASELEWQQLEKLSSQAKSLKMAIEFGHETMLAASLVPISEQVEYSRLRLAEGKLEWLGPWMAAEAIRIEALRSLASTPKALSVVQNEVAQFRIRILNYTGRLVVGSMDEPWLKIASFVDGRDDALLYDIANASELQVADIVPDAPAKKPTARKAQPATTALASTAWPFPTTSRP